MCMPSDPDNVPQSNMSDALMVLADATYQVMTDWAQTARCVGAIWVQGRKRLTHSYSWQQAENQPSAATHQYKKSDRSDIITCSCASRSPRISSCKYRGHGPLHS